MNEDEGYNARITRLENQVRTLIENEVKRQSTDAMLKSQAAQTQATEHLYAPLRNDVKAITELSAFVRRAAEGYYRSYVAIILERDAKALLELLTK